MVKSMWFAWLAIIFYVPLCRPEISKNCGMLYLTITAETKNLAFNWVFTCGDHPDTVILYERLSDKTRVFKELTRISIAYGRRIGHVDTGYKWSFVKFPGNWNKDDEEAPTSVYCLKYYIVSMKESDYVDWECLRIQPDWMKNFGLLRIGQMFIPGSYHSAAIRTYQPLNRFVRHQGFLYWGQLVFGMRYFDINIGHSGNSLIIFGEFGIPFPQIRLQTYLESIAIFLKKSKKEVIILDFRTFANFTEAVHDKLVKLLKRSFSGMLAPTTMNKHKFGPRLGELWETNQRVIANYRYKTTVNDNSDILWNEIKMKDGKAQSVETLERYVKENARDHRHDEMSCNMLTALEASWHVRAAIGTEGLADRVNSNLSNWLHKNGLLHHINIISLSHFDGSRIVSDAIEANEKKVYVP